MSGKGVRLVDMRLAPPPVDRFVRPPGRSMLSVPLGATEERGRVPLPFFWHDPSWHLANPAHCRAVAAVVAGCGITIGMAENDLGEDEAVTAAGVEGNGGQAVAASEAAGLENWSRLAIHRPDRAGWTLDDCISSRVIELRLGMRRAAGEGFAYPAERYSRWYGGVATGPDGALPPLPLFFPPEWADLSTLGSQVAQLRSLSDAAIYVSCDESQVDVVLPAVHAGNADGILIRFQDDPVTLLRHCHRIMDERQWASRPRVWISGRWLGVEDTVKCFALGAAAVAIDELCDPWLSEPEYGKLFPAGTSPFPFGAMVGKTQQQRFLERIREQIVGCCDSLAAVVQALGASRIEELDAGHLIVADDAWGS